MNAEHRIDLSLIVPLYNRPDEISELLESLTHQSDPDFEVVIVEDGSDVDSADIVRAFQDRLKLQYIVKKNDGPGPARNTGSEHAGGNYFVFLDSDCIIPDHYVATVKAELASGYVDAWGGPDRAHPSFTDVQKSINYAMTSLITTGGIRGGEKRLDTFHPRSFNMGIAAGVYRKLGGFSRMRFGEDVDLSLRIVEAGYRTRLFPEAYVYHKRRTDFRKFFRQVHNSGIARIHLAKRHPGSLKWVHALPSAFLIFLPLCAIAALAWTPWVLILPTALFLIVFMDALRCERSLSVAFLSVAAVLVQWTGYGSGFLRGVWRRVILKRGEFNAFEETFYK